MASNSLFKAAILAVLSAPLSSSSNLSSLTISASVCGCESSGSSDRGTSMISSLCSTCGKADGSLKPTDLLLSLLSPLHESLVGRRSSVWTISRSEVSSGLPEKEIVEKRRSTWRSGETVGPKRRSSKRSLVAPVGAPAVAEDSELEKVDKPLDRR